MTPSIGLPRLDGTFSELEKEYLILDAGCLFVAGTLREEVWLYRSMEDPVLLENLVREAGAFHLEDLDPDRPLSTYSGGEQALVACLLVMALIRAFDLEGVKVLLSGVLESLSTENRRALTEKLTAMAAGGQVEVFVKKEAALRPLEAMRCAF